MTCCQLLHRGNVLGLLLVCLVSLPAAANEHSGEEPVDLSSSRKQAVDLATSPKTSSGAFEIVHDTPATKRRSETKTSALGESLQTKAGMNPNCVGTAMPVCTRGTVDLEACKCKCPWNWKGDACDTCNAAACKNGGTMEMAGCACKCVEGFSGADCSQGSKCLNGGTDVGGTCTCANAWKGETCKSCDLTCMNGGTKDAAHCKCSCPANRKEPDCKVCQDPGCVNKGVFQNKKDENGVEQCGCKCTADHAWSGVKCDKCPANTQCKNSATFNKAACKCQCANDNWSGKFCGLCDHHCFGGKRLDENTCMCVDPPNKNFNPCVTGCKHGTLDVDKCTCNCKPGFKGIFCDECEIEKCLNNGKLQFEIDCKCKCAEPFTGKKCETCPIECGPHGKVKEGCGGCLCDTTSAGKWTGDHCDTCEHPSCGAHGTLNKATCACECNRGYSGDLCNTCSLTQSDCTHGSTIVPENCACDCTKGAAALGDWSGQVCDECNHRGCANGGEVNPTSCRCECVPLWMGRYCKACGNDFCEAAASGADVLGQNGIADKATDPGCKWVRDDLGCPRP